MSSSSSQHSSSHQDTSDLQTPRDSGPSFDATFRDATFGFLNVIDLPSLGHCGGLLTVSSIGRPIEFHCTAPLATNRAQQIMYGQTYLGFLYSDQIGAALVEKLRQPPSMILTNSPDMLPIGELIDLPVVMIEPRDAAPPFDGSGLPSFETAEHRCWSINAAGTELLQLQAHATRFASKLPFDEPMERIAQAVEEAHSVLRAAG